jgi:hypothetical protein
MQNEAGPTMQRCKDIAKHSSCLPSNHLARYFNGMKFLLPMFTELQCAKLEKYEFRIGKTRL